MKRSEINQIIREMEALAAQNGFYLPPFCHFTPEEWKEKGHEYDEIRDNMLGWDITDFGRGDFNTCGFGLITLRNGNQHNPKYKKVYAEKLLFMRDGMMAPMHFHWFKSEDIINRGGGTLQIKIYNDDGEGGLSDEDVLVNSDGRSYKVPAGSYVTLKPGESVTLWPHQYHEFHAVPGTARCHSAMMTIQITGFMRRRGGFLKSRKMRRLTGCSVTNIRRRWIEGRIVTLGELTPEWWI